MLLFATNINAFCTSDIQIEYLCRVLCKFSGNTEARLRSNKQNFKVHTKHLLNVGANREAHRLQFGEKFFAQRRF